MKNLLPFIVLGLSLPFTSRAQLASAATRELETSGEDAATATPTVLTYAEQMPAFIGGEPALRQYLATHLTYPSEAARHSLSGTVVVQFVVDEQGRVLDTAVVCTSDETFDAEALRVVRLMPWWTPGQQQGHPVRVQCTLPLTFTFKRSL